MAATHDDEIHRQRQVIYWRALAAAFGMQDQTRNFNEMTGQIVKDLEMPEVITDPNLSIDALLQRYPELKSDFSTIEKICAPPPEEEEAKADEEADKPAVEAPSAEEPMQSADLRRALAYSKLLLNVFGPNTMTSKVSAQQYNQWCQDVGHFEKSFGFRPGELRGKRSGGGGGGGGPGASTSGTGMGRLLSDQELQAGLIALEGELIHRMELREVLKDDQMAARLTPSLPLLEQLLYDKSNLSGNALKNARDLIRRYVDQVAEVLKLQVMKAVAGKIDRSVPPKRVYRNLDLKRTLWKNLPNFNPLDGHLYVDQLYYRQTAKKTTPTRMIVVVDQSGSMVDAMVQCTILASIFAGLPRVDVHLFAFDTEVIDLTPWVHDPFEVLMRTNLGGGTLICKALIEAAKKIEEPRNTAVVLISDFYEGGSDQVLLDYIKGLKDSGVHFIPVGAVTSSGYFSLNQWFRTRLKELGMPVLSGSIKKLIQELKDLI